MVMRAVYPSFLLALVLGFSSCKTVYEPNAINTPMLKNKGEFRLYAGTTDLQASYAVTDHVGVMLNGFHVSEKSDNNVIHGSGGLIEGGIGYFTSLQPLLFEVYAGGGRGGVSFSETRTENGVQTVREFSADGTRFFLQPGLGLTTQYFDLGITPRFVVGKYDNVITNYSTQDQIDGHFYQVDQPTWAFIEPAFTVRGGYRFVKLQLQYGFSSKLNSQALSYKSSFLNVGLSFDLNRNWE